MLRRILEKTHRDLVRELRGQLDQLRVVLVRGAAPEDDQKALARSIAQLDDLFLLVVAGEFNAGKSAVINALLGEAAVEEGVTPTTSRIQLLRHGGDRRRRPAGGGFEEITLPVKILREMNVVDTPGTNAVIEGHETLTREFVPRSDLVLFVTSADRPFTASERAFLETIRDWGKKVVVAINKTDILDRPQDVEKVVAFVQDKLRTLLGLRPEVFAVSARRAQKLKAAGIAPNPEASGFDALEAWITRTLDDAQRVRLKLLNPVGVGTRVLSQAASGVEERLVVLDADAAALKEVDAQIARHREDLVRELRPRLSDIDKPLLELERRGEAYLERTLSFGRVGSLLSRTETQRAFERQVVAGLRHAVEKRVDGLVDAMVTSETRLGEAVQAVLAPRLALHAGWLPDPVNDIPPPDRARLRGLLLRAQRTLESYDSRGEARRVASAALRAALGAALLLIGAFGVGVAAVTLGSTTTAAAGLAVSGAMAAVGLTLLPALRRRQRGRLRERLAEVRQKLAAAVRAVLEREQETGPRRVREAIAPYERFVRAESEQLRAGKEELARLGAGLDALRGRIEALG